MAMSRKELFEKAKEERKKEKALKDSQSSSSWEGSDTIAYTALGGNTGRVIRIFGNPIVSRQNPTDPKLSFISMILGDNGKKFRCIWPDKKEDPDWLLWKIYDLVSSCTYKGFGDERERIYTYKSSHPECWRRVVKNNNVENRFETGWRPTGFVNMNVIDRHDPEFHKDQKHSKLISKKASEMSNGGYWYEPGIPITGYNAIWDNVVEFYGDWEDYDISLKKLTDKPWYTAVHAVAESIKLSKEESSVVVDGPLTEEEKTYELYSLDHLFKVTPYTKIKSRLGKFIRKVDADFDKNFTEELEELCEKEQAEWTEKTPDLGKQVREPEEKVKEDVPFDGSSEMKEESKSEPKPEVEIRSRTPKKEEPKKEEIPWDKLADGTFNGTLYEGVSSMTDEEKEMVVRIKPDGSFEYMKEWKGEKVELLESATSKFVSPAQFHIDPLSGEIFE